MRRTYALLGTAVLSATATAVLVLHALGVSNTGVHGVRLEFQTISRGMWSGHTSCAYYVIQNMEDWRRIWNQHQRCFVPPCPPPEVDFSEATVVAVFMGECLTTGYSIEVKEIIDTGLTVFIKVEKAYPGKNCVVGEALTYPYHIIKTGKISKQVIFQTFERETSCG